MGVILRATPDDGPHYDEPFVIVDRDLTIQAISHRAEAVLMVEEPVGVGVPVEKFLVSVDGDIARRELADSVEQAIAGTPTTSTLELRTVANGELRLAGRVASCGPPQAALLILSPLDSHQLRGRAAKPARRRGAAARVVRHGAPGQPAR